MADLTRPSKCIPYKNSYCRGPISGISVIQPECQSLPDGSLVTNPTYIPSLASSFWTYKFMIDCCSLPGGMKSIALPVCRNIKEQFVKLYEKIDDCGTFTSVPFILVKRDPRFGFAPLDYYWLIVENGGRYCDGLSVIYLLELIGDFSARAQVVKVDTSLVVLSFGFRGPLVPECNPQGNLSIKNNCSIIIEGNQAALNYTIDIINSGGSSLNNVMYHDVIRIPLEIGLGKIVITPSTLTADTSVSGRITIKGNLGRINEGQVVSVTYSIPLISISKSQSYTINNAVQAYAQGTESHASCSVVLEAVELSASMICNITEGNKGKFTIILSNVPYSPDTAVNIEDHLTIPEGFTLKFTDFGGCTAVFTNGGEPVPLGVDITGPIDITLTCNNFHILKDSCGLKTIAFTVISGTLPGSTSIENCLTKIDLADADSQILLGIGQLPVKASIDVLYDIGCSLS